jgi:hypothetical protein
LPWATKRSSRKDAYLREIGRTSQGRRKHRPVDEAFSVLLERYGRVNVQVAAPFDMAQFLAPWILNPMLSSSA